jgi:Rod binding domain-containing protein
MDAMNPIPSLQIADAAGKRGVPRLEQPKPVDEAAARMRKLEQATSDFEAIFLTQLLKPLAKSISNTSQGSQLGADVMMGVAMEKMAEALADRGGIGLGDLLLENLKDRLNDNPVPSGPQEDKPISLKSDGTIFIGLPTQGPPTPVSLKTGE